MMKRFLLLVGLCALIAPSVEARGAVDGATKKMQQALRYRNQEEFEKGVRFLVSLNNGAAVKALTRFAYPARQTGDAWYWMVVKGIASFNNADALAEVEKFVLRNKYQGISRDVMYWFQSNYSRDLIPFLVRIAQKGRPDLQVQAVTHLVTLGNQEAVDPLIELLAKYRSGSGWKAELRRKIAQGLETITGANFGEKADLWRNWWAANRSRQRQGKDGSGRNTGTAADGLDRGRRNEYETVIVVPKEKIVVVKADKNPRGHDLNYDRIEEILTRMKIPHIVVTKKDFSDSRFSMRGRIAVLFNCNMFREHCVAPGHKGSGGTTMRLRTCVGPGPHKPYSSKFGLQAVKKAYDFVASGGYLFSEDWILEELLARSGGFLPYVGVGRALEDRVVDIYPEPGTTSHPYIGRIFAPIQKESGAWGKKYSSATFETPKHSWKIDKDSTCIRVKSPAVKILISAPKLINDPKSRDERAVAITFGVGGSAAVTGAHGASSMRGGRVLHVLSHFGKQESEKDGHTLQNLLLNYLMEAIRRHNAKGRRRR